jgi:hypothetical protein
MARASEILRQFAIDPLRHRSAALFLFRLSQLAHERLDGRADEYIVRLSAMLRPKIPLPPSTLMDAGSIPASVAALRARGWDILPARLSPDAIAEIECFAFSTPAYARSPAERIALSASVPPREEPRYEWRMGELLRLGAVQTLLRDGALHGIAQDYLGCRPVLTSVTLWLDTIHDGAYDAHVYHYDNDGPAFLKFFIYISDVDADSGAHTYIQGSHGHRKPARFRRSRRYERDELLAHYGSDSEMVFAAPAGTILAEDTAGFHRGMDPKTRPRLLMQLEYAALDIPHAEEFVLGVPKVAIAGLAPGAARIARKFARAG